MKRKEEKKRNSDGEKKISTIGSSGREIKVELA
jgi:hypothetical protein